MMEQVLAYFFIAALNLFPPKDMKPAATTAVMAEKQSKDFRNPLDIPIALAANFGEIRKDHFHMGLDIRTQGRENLNVYAAADGYVSKISVSEGGFGNAIYITHFNGYTTVYAHLNKYFDALAKRVKEMQYARERWEIELDFGADEFPVKRGQFIALSGNTGASGGPHLHFEVRDTKSGNNMNPLQFGLGVPDNIPPTIYGVYYYDRNYSSYDVAPKQIIVKKQGSEYVGGVQKTGSDKIIFGVRAEDKSSNSPFMFGIYYAELFVDEQPANSFTLDNFDYTVSRAVNAAVDYTTWINKDQAIQYFAKLPGNPIDIYNEHNGVIDIGDGKLHSIKMIIKDIEGNTSVVRFNVQYDAALKDPLMFTADRFKLIPNQPNRFKTENTELQFDKMSLYDTVNLTVREQFSAGTNALPMVDIGSGSIPIHAPYTIKLKMPATTAAQYKNNIVMQLTGYRLNQVKKGTWDGEWMSASFNKFGKAQLVVDLQPPMIQPIGFSDGSSIGNTAIRVRVNDDLGLKNFRGELDGKYLLFKKSGETFTYTVDEHAPTGTHSLKLIAEDVAGNIIEKTYSINRTNVAAKKTVVKKKVVRKKR
jgi:murein DD-endopeptidase MepM/ murein hydrolase activator NlpD